jgi:LysR family transcriptional regulator, glycine cleavage system transcriptional activator
MAGSSSASPLRALQAFSAVARTGSVVGAAEELTVTASAISHLVRQLERRLGVVLFTRKGRGLTPTLDGERLAAAVGPALVTIDDALSGLRRRSAELRISMLSSFAVHWLIPRLSRFQTQHPNIELFLSTSTRIVDLTAEAFDCAIRLGRGGWPNVAADELYREELVTACSPLWLAARQIRSPRDLVRAKLLHARARRQDWVHWFRAAGVPDFKVGSGPVFETRALAIQAAIAQMGVVAVDPRFIEAELAAGQLTIPFPLRVALDSAYWLVWCPGREAAQPVAAFRRWLAAEVALAPGRSRR